MRYHRKRNATRPAAYPRHEGHLQGLARRIRALRERRGLTQEDFAARCGISVSFASLLERGERSPSYETLLQVAAALGLPPSELFRLEEDDDTGADRLVHFVRQRRLDARGRGPAADGGGADVRGGGRPAEPEERRRSPPAAPSPAVGGRCWPEASAWPTTTGPAGRRAPSVRADVGAVANLQG